jgi:DnaA family protein
MLSLKQTASLDNYISGDNVQTLSEVKSCTQARNGAYLYLWGAKYTGKTHIATAAARMADGNGLATAFVPLSKAEVLAPEMLDDIEQMDLLCLDDIQDISGDKAWENALFNLFNRARDHGANLIITSDCGPSSLKITLPDLVSRLASGISYRLAPLDDTSKMELLISRANERGMELTQETASYILKNFSRNTGTLLEFLDQLDQTSLAAQRKLTIPFVRSLITP